MMISSISKYRFLFTFSIVLMLTIPTLAALPDLELIDFGKHHAQSSARLTTTKDVTVQWTPDQWLKVNAGHTTDWPGMNIKPDGKYWDLSSYYSIILEVKNTSPVELQVNCRVDNEGADGSNNCITSSINLDPGESSPLIVHIYPSPWVFSDDTKLIGMRGYPAGKGLIDPAKINQIIIFLARPDRDHTFEIKNLRATGQLKTIDSDNFFPFIDTFGQYIHDDWPGKTHSLEELRQSIVDERNDLDAHPGPKDRNNFGGWTKGPKLTATGFFRVQKYQGRWWMVDPTGHLFWSQGIDCVGFSNSTPISDREFYYADLPGDDSPLKAFYGRGSWAPHGYYNNHSPYRTFDFLQANLYRKYGTDWKDRHRTVTFDRLHSWGINTIGNWSEWSIYNKRKVPYVGTVGFSSRVIEGSQGYWGKFFDVFDPSFRKNCAQTLDRHVKDSMANDPWCLGFFVHNEIAWGNEYSLALASLASPADQPAKKVFIDQLRIKYKTVDALNKQWKTKHASWDAMLNSTDLPDKVNAKDDLLSFYRRIAETYFGIIRDELKKVAPHQMYMGCRFSAVNDLAATVAAQYCDIVCYNRYDYSVANFRMPNNIDKPIIIGEFHFGALDRGMFHTGLKATDNQDDRAETYTSYVRGALRNRYIVGAHWFQYNSQATTGRGDGENYQIGFVDICDRPYTEIVDAARKIADDMYHYRMTQ